MSKRFIMRVYHERRGGHTHIKVFTGQSDTMRDATLGLAGNLVMTNEEFETWQNKNILLQFIPVEGGSDVSNEDRNRSSRNHA